MRILATLGSPDHTIGGAGIVPWTIPDLRHQIFEEVEDKIVVIGRRSWDLLGAELPCHRAVILTRDSPASNPKVEASIEPGDALRVPNLALALSTARDLDPEREVLVVGGASVFRQALPLAQGMVLAVIKSPVPGDLHFPDFSDKEWWIEDTWEHPSFELLRYGRRVVA